MPKNVFNPVEDILHKAEIKLTKESDIRKLPISVKIDVAIAWMQHESLKGCGFIRAGGRQEGVFMGVVILPAFEALIDRFNDWADIQPLSVFDKERSYTQAKCCLFINGLVEFGERLITIYFKGKKKLLARKDKKSGL